VPEGIAEELAQVLAEPVPEPGRYGRDGSFTHLLVSRRVQQASNSIWRVFPRSRGRANPAYLHPEDLAALGLASGELVWIESEDGRVEAVVEADPTLLRGVVSMAHCFGGDPDQEGDPREVGTPVNALISLENACDPWVGMARQSAIPVRLARHERRP
jgi:anaerobic selenocysteine-containing dehydrogenase